MKKFKDNTESETFCMEGNSEKYTVPLSSKIHCYVKNRYRSNRKSVRFLLREIPKLVLKKNCQKWLQCLSDFSSLNTVKVMLITCTVMPFETLLATTTTHSF